MKPANSVAGSPGQRQFAGSSLSAIRLTSLRTLIFLTCPVTLGFFTSPDDDLADDLMPLRPVRLAAERTEWRFWFWLAETIRRHHALKDARTLSWRCAAEAAT
jgi:hypothetical protein